MTAVRALPRRVADEVIDAINLMDEQALERFGAWQPLADLSSRTRFEAIDGDPDSVVVDASGSFEAIATVYVTLIYGASNDEASIGDEYIATVTGRLDLSNEVVVEAITFDTAPFYE